MKRVDTESRRNLARSREGEKVQSRKTLYINFVLEAAAIVNWDSVFQHEDSPHYFLQPQQEVKAKGESQAKICFPGKRSGMGQL